MDMSVISSSLAAHWPWVIGLIGVAMASVWAGSASASMRNAKEYFDDPNTAVLAEAAAKGNEKKVAEAMGRGGQVNARGKTGITPLLYVMAKTLNKEGMRILLRHGADPNYISPSGTGPLITSAQGKDPEFLAILLDGGGNPNLQNHDGESAVFLAGQQSRWKNLDLLLKKGGDINARDRSGYTLVMLLTMLAQFDQAEKLIQQGANTAAVAANGHTLAAILEDRLTMLPPQSPQYTAAIQLKKALKKRP